jgi:hypothetical protein
VDHIENEKKILEILEHPFIVRLIKKTILFMIIVGILWIYAR